MDFICEKEVRVRFGSSAFSKSQFGFGLFSVSDLNLSVGVPLCNVVVKHNAKGVLKYGG